MGKNIEARLGQKWPTMAYQLFTCLKVASSKLGIKILKLGWALEKCIIMNKLKYLTILKLFIRIFVLTKRQAKTLLKSYDKNQFRSWKEKMFKQRVKNIMMKVFPFIVQSKSKKTIQIWVKKIEIKVGL